MSMDFGFADILSLGVSFTQKIGYEVTEESFTFKVPPSRIGDMGFTAHLDLQEGGCLMYPSSWYLLT